MQAIGDITLWYDRLVRGVLGTASSAPATGAVDLSLGVSDGPAIVNRIPVGATAAVAITSNVGQVVIRPYRLFFMSALRGDGVKEALTWCIDAINTRSHEPAPRAR